MIDFFANNASAVFALLGVLVTGLISSLSTTKAAKLRLIEKILDKKLQAHEHVITVANRMRTMVALGGPDNSGELKRTPAIMESRDNFSEFMVDFAVMQTQCDRWLSSDLKKEISLFLDYFVNLNEYTRAAKDENIQEAGALIRSDFVDFSSRLENIAHEYFNNDLLHLKYKTDRDWHKYPQNTTLEKLGETVLFQKKQEVRDILQFQ